MSKKPAAGSKKKAARPKSSSAPAGRKSTKSSTNSAASSASSSPSPAPSPAEEQFHLVVLNPHGESWHEGFPDREELCLRLRELYGNDCHVFVFAGQRLQITQPPFRYLLAAGEEPYPLFTLPDPAALAVDEEGFLGTVPVEMANPEAEDEDSSPAESPPPLTAPTESTPPDSMIDDEVVESFFND